MGKVVIVGAGIIGLYTALLLSERGMGSDITVVAKNLPGDLSIEYTSPIAGAHFTPAFGGGDERITRFGPLSYPLLKFLFKKFENELEEAGLARLPQVEYFEEPLDSKQVDSFRYVETLEIITDKDDLARNKAAFGMRSVTFNFNSPKLLLFLKKYLEKQGVTFIKTAIKRLTDAPSAASVPDPSVVFNCTGFLAPQLEDFSDSSSNYPVRGQTVAIRAPWINSTYVYDPVNDPPTYVIPRPYSNGRVILGGYFDKGDTTSGTTYEQSQSIIARTTERVPELLKHGPLEVIDERAGLRPGRDGGPRIERENLDGLPVIHNYGAGGVGYLCGLAMAQEAINLFYG